jgi:hypothetical protein
MGSLGGDSWGEFYTADHIHPCMFIWRVETFAQLEVMLGFIVTFPNGNRERRGGRRLLAKAKAKRNSETYCISNRGRAPPHRRTQKKTNNKVRNPQSGGRGPKVGTL